MTAAELSSAPEALQRQFVVGTIGIVTAVGLALILGGHPFGSTDLYDDGERFVNHVGPFWVAIHFVGALLFLAVPTIVGAWGETLRSAAGRVIGRLAVTVATVGVAIATLHLVGTDTTTFLAYEDTLRSGIEGAAAGADVLLRIHAATLMAMVISLFVALPLSCAVAAALERETGWQLWLPAVVATISAAAAGVTLVEGQWTTLSEMGLFRPAITLFLVWLGVIGYRLRRHARAGELVAVPTAS